MLQLISLSILFIAIYSLYYLFFCAQKPKLIYNKYSANSYWHDKNIPEILTNIWYPPYLLCLSHLQNLFYEGMILKSPEVIYDERVVIESDDGGVFAIDILYPDIGKENKTKSRNLIEINKKNEIFDRNNNNLPLLNSFYSEIDEILLIYPGVTGKSPDPYIKRLAHICKYGKTNNKKILIAVMIQRGYDGLDISSTCPKLNGVTNTIDIKLALKYLCKRFNTKKGNKKLNANNSITKVVAFSFGAIQTRLLLGSKSTKNEKLESWYPKAVLLNSCPLMLEITTLEKFEVLYHGLFYNRLALKRMTKILLKHDIVIPSILNKCKVMRHLDDKVTGPSWGFKGWKDMYAAASLTENDLQIIKIPVIVLNSKDDPLIPDIPTIDSWFNNSESVLFAKTCAGGHCAFLKFGWLLKSSLSQKTYFEDLYETWLGMDFC